MFRAPVMVYFAIDKFETSFLKNPIFASGKHIGKFSEQCIQDLTLIIYMSKHLACHPRILKAGVLDIITDKTFMMGNEWLQKSTDGAFFYRLFTGSQTLYIPEPF
jgi:hypothetical protein